MQVLMTKPSNKPDTKPIQTERAAGRHGHGDIQLVQNKECKMLQPVNTVVPNFNLPVSSPAVRDGKA